MQHIALHVLTAQLINSKRVLKKLTVTQLPLKEPDGPLPCS